MFFGESDLLNLGLATPEWYLSNLLLIRFSSRSIFAESPAPPAFNLCSSSSADLVKSFVVLEISALSAICLLISLSISTELSASSCLSFAMLSAFDLALSSFEGCFFFFLPLLPFLDTCDLCGFSSTNSLFSRLSCWAIALSSSELIFLLCLPSSSR